MRRKKGRENLYISAGNLFKNSVQSDLVPSACSFFKLYKTAEKHIRTEILLKREDKSWEPGWKKSKTYFLPGTLFVRKEYMFTPKFSFFLNTLCILV